MPPAFNLSQDQTLQFVVLSNAIKKITMHYTCLPWPTGFDCSNPDGLAGSNNQRQQTANLLEIYEHHYRHHYQ
jgi:hypothetical protein